MRQRKRRDIRQYSASSRKSKKRTLYALYGGMCFECAVEHEMEQLTFHHIVEVSNGGSNRNENLRLVCHPCHRRLHEPRLRT